MSSFEKEKKNFFFLLLIKKKIMKIIGCCHPPGQSKDYNGFLLKQDEIEEFSKSIIGKPIWYEHQQEHVIGKVGKAWTGEKGELMIEAEIDGRNPIGAKSIMKMRNGEIVGLSLGIDHLFDKDKFQITDRNIQEVTLTTLPDLPGTNISYVEPRDKDTALRREYIEIFFENEGLKKTLETIKATKSFFFTNSGGKNNFGQVQKQNLLFI